MLAIARADRSASEPAARTSRSRTSGRGATSLRWTERAGWRLGPTAWARERQLIQGALRALGDAPRRSGCRVPSSAARRRCRTGRRGALRYLSRYRGRYQREVLGDHKPPHGDLHRLPRATLLPAVARQRTPTCELAGKLCAMRMDNLLIAAVLRSPAHQVLSRSTILLRYQGRKSGREYTIPVQYAVMDGQLLL